MLMLQRLLSCAVLFLFAHSSYGQTSITSDAQAEVRLKEIYQKNYGIKPTHLLIDKITSAYGRSPGSTVCCFNIEGNIWRAVLMEFDKKRVLNVYLRDDGFVRLYENGILVPRGEVNVITVMIDNGLTDLVQKVDLWEQYTEKLNQGWAAHFRSLGFEQSPVWLKNTNVVVDAADFGNRNSNDLDSYLTGLGYDTAQYGQFILIKLDPMNPDGGAQSGNSLTVNYHFLKAEGFVKLSNAQMSALVGTTYRHELGHGFGWDHNWPGEKSTDSFITNPEYYGWVDVDGDGIIEILDPTPWGIGADQLPADDDNDGVPNNKDKCPNTKFNNNVDASGCAPAQLDDDNDGVNNTVDTCPNTEANVIVDDKGCEIKDEINNTDTDADGVSDFLDQCPNTPAGTEVTAQGCKVISIGSYNFYFVLMLFMFFCGKLMCPKAR